MTAQTAPTITILGGAVHTGNNGVSALGYSLMKLLREAIPDCALILQTWQEPPATVVARTPDGNIEAEVMLIYQSQDATSPGGSARIRDLFERWKKASPEERPAIQKEDITFDQLMRTDVVLDITGGDSLADIYGHYNSATIELVMDLDIPIILPPQTYGPFKYDDTRAIVQRLLDYSELIATREIEGEAELKKEFSIDKPIYTTTDVAFMLDPMPPEQGGDPDDAWFAARGEDEIVIGLNVSGLLYLSEQDFGLKSDYPHLVDRLIHSFLDRPNVRVLLVPHVLSHEPVTEQDLDTFEVAGNGDVSDSVACAQLARDLKGRYGDRLHVLSWGYGPNETWYYIGQCDFFMGARMHSCIGAVSQAVPTAPISYSKKALGVMTHLGIADKVVDPRALDEAECLDKIEAIFRDRQAVQETLAAALPDLRRQLTEFFRGPMKDAVLAAAGR